MKKRILMLFAAALCLSCLVCTASAVPAAEDQLATLAAHAAEWLETEPSLVGDVFYAVTDLDQNGQLELLRASQLGWRIDYPLSGFEVNEDGTGLTALAFTEEPFNVDLVFKWLSGITNGDEICYYVHEDTGDPMGGGTRSGLMSLRDGKLALKLLTESYTGTTSFGVASAPSYLYFEHMAEEDFLETYSNWNYFEVRLGWLRLTGSEDLKAVLLDSWQQFGDPEYEPELDGVDSFPRATVYFDTEGSDYHRFDGQVLRISTGFEFFSDETVRVVVHNEGARLRMEGLCYAQLSENDFGVEQVYDIFSFTPMVGKVYEIPFDIYNGISVCRLVLDDGSFPAYLNSFGHQEDGFPMRYSSYELRCGTRPRYPSDSDAILDVCRIFAGWAMSSGGASNTPSDYWDILSNCISYNMGSLVQTDSQGFFQVPSWLVREYASSIFSGVDWDWNAPDMTATSAIRTVPGTDDFLTVVPNLRFQDLGLRVQEIMTEDSIGFDPSLGETAVVVVVEENGQEEAVVIYLNHSDSSALGWYFTKVLIANG